MRDVISSWSFCNKLGAMHGEQLMGDIYGKDRHLKNHHLIMWESIILVLFMYVKVVQM